MALRLRKWISILERRFLYTLVMEAVLPSIHCARHVICRSGAALRPYRWTLCKRDVEPRGEFFWKNPPFGPLNEASPLGLATRIRFSSILPAFPPLVHVCVPDVVGLLTVRWHSKPKPKKKRDWWRGIISQGFPSASKIVFAPFSLGYPLSVFHKNTTLKKRNSASYSTTPFLTTHTCVVCECDL